MNAGDQQKVCYAGFMVIRAEERNGRPIIKCKSYSHPYNWVTHRNDFKSKAERDRYMKKLLEKSNVIED